jgi:undecaprenyl diphosphate synthase
LQRSGLLKEIPSSEERLLAQVDAARLPAHIAIIMDGNGRWAGKRRLPRVAGHRAGADAVRRTVEAAARLDVRYLTLFAFSTENWKRPRLEVDALMKLLKEFIRKELASLKKNNIRFQMIGRREGLERSVLQEIDNAEQQTSENTGLVLSIALNYGGRAEITDACRSIAAGVAARLIDPEQIDDQLIARYLCTQFMPDPDLLIRTSGEMRVSNFLIWQIAYAEIHVTQTLWPDFGEVDLLAAILDYQKRDRRFGAVRNEAAVL